MFSNMKGQVSVHFKDGCRKLQLNEMSDDDEFGSEDEDDYQMDLNAIAGRKPSKKMVSLYISETNESVYDLKTRKFHWAYPWLRVKVEVDTKNLIKELKNDKFRTVNYQLNEDPGISMISMFLNSLFLSGRSFRELVGKLPSNLRLSSLIEHLKDVLGECETCDPVTLGEVRDVLTGINTTDVGALLKLATTAPNFFEESVTLFPKKITALLSTTIFKKGLGEGNADADNLWSFMEAVYVSAPWKLGFSDVMFKEMKDSGLGFSGLEVSWKQLQSSRCFNTIEPKYKKALAIYDVLKTNCQSDGHTFLYFNDVIRNYKYYNSKNRYNCFKGFNINREILESLNTLMELEVVKEVKKNDYPTFHLMRYWRAEETIREKFKVLLNGECNWTHLLDLHDTRFTRIRQDEKQKQAADLILAKPISVISGRGGTGKTEVVTTILEAVDEMWKKDKNKSSDDFLDMEDQDSDSSPASVARRKLNFTSPEEQSQTLEELSEAQSNKNQVESNGYVLYAAPTGKAASVIRKRVKKKAFTIHQVLGSWKIYQKKSEGASATPAKWKFEGTRVLALDETSMVSLELFSILLRCLISSSNLEKVILLGDRLQLPSIEPGSLMTDLYEALGEHNMVLELTTNHRSEGSVIFENAKAISEQKMPKFSKSGCFQMLSLNSKDATNSGITCWTDMESSKMFRWYNMYKPFEISEEKRNVYFTLLKKYRDEFNLNDQTTSQFIAFRNKECEAVNEMSCFIYNKHYMFEAQKNSWKKSKVFEVNDKIMATKNNNVDILEPITEALSTQDNKECKWITERMMNGSIYIIKGDTKHMDQSKGETAKDKFIHSKLQKVWVLDDLDGEKIMPEKQMFRAVCQPKHAWALTIHKFQGSEANHIVYGVSDSKYETWQHVYTAVTRGKKSVLIVGTMADLEKAIKTKPRPRQTGLKDKIIQFLQESLNDHDCQKRNISSSDDKLDYSSGNTPAFKAKLSLKV